jgi:flagellar biosynthetic protein FliS
MHDTSRTYFEDRIRTASPEQLQFMLIDGALAAARRAERLLTADRPLHANVELARAEAILAEIVSAFRKEAAPQLVERTVAVYAFVIRRLTDAHLSADVAAVREAIRVLEVEHETWRLVCERAATPAPVPPPHRAPTSQVAFESDHAVGGFCAEA